MRAISLDGVPYPEPRARRAKEGTASVRLRLARVLRATRQRERELRAQFQTQQLQVGFPGQFTPTPSGWTQIVPTGYWITWSDTNGTYTTANVLPANFTSSIGYVSVGS